MKLANARRATGALAALSTADPNTCAYNDFALVEVDAADTGKVNPSVPFWGGPVGIDSDGTSAGERVYSYGSSSLRFGAELLSPKTAPASATPRPTAAGATRSTP